MATFTEAQVTDLAAILEVDSLTLTDRLDFYAPSISEADKTKVLELVTTWETAGVNFTAIEPKEANFGARINPNDYKSQIKRQIASLIYCKDLVNGAGQTRLVRG